MANAVVIFPNLFLEGSHCRGGLLEMTQSPLLKHHHLDTELLCFCFL